MKYTISINQKAVRDNNWNLKANHMAILQVVCEWVVNPKCLKIQDDKGTWFWVSHKIIIDELPMFDVKERRCLDLIKDLESCQLLELNPNNKQLGRTFMRVGLNYEKLNSDYAKSCEPTQKIAKPIAINCVPPTQKIADYNNTNENKTKDKYVVVPPEQKPEIQQQQQQQGFDLAGKEMKEFNEVVIQSTVNPKLDKKQTLEILRTDLDLINQVLREFKKSNIKTEYFCLTNNDIYQATDKFKKWYESMIEDCILKAGNEGKFPRKLGDTKMHVISFLRYQDFTKLKTQLTPTAAINQQAYERQYD
jgi:hypothetical protein